MAELLQFICENSDHSQISAVLKRFVEQKDLVVDTNFLESLKLVLRTLEKSNNFSEDLASKVLRDICWPIVYDFSHAKDNNQPCGNNRKRLHLCYDIAAFCCSVFPTTLLSDVCERCLLILRRFIVEKSATEENARDVSVTLDLIGSLVKSDALNTFENTSVISGELGDQLFQELLNILPHTTENLCAKVTSLVLPSFLEFKKIERCEAVWNVVKQISQSKVPGAGIGRLDQTYAILCGLADFFSSPGNYNLFDKADFWEIIQKGLVLNEPLSRKRAMYLLKRALDLLDKQPSDLSVMSEKGCCIFYWSSGKKESLMSTWQDFVLLMETLDEKQAHIIKPVLPRMSSIVSATKKSANGYTRELLWSCHIFVVDSTDQAFYWLHDAQLYACSRETMLDISWLLTLYQRADQHDNKFICRWAILDLLSMDLSCSPLLNTCYWWFLYGPLMSMLNEYAIYGRTDDDARGDPPAVGAAVVAFFKDFAEHLPVNDRQSFCGGLLSAIVKQEFTQVPLVFMTQMLASLPLCPAWDSHSLASIHDIFPLFRTFNLHMSSAIQSFLLKAVLNLTDPRRVQWSDIRDFLSLLSEDDCLRRGNVLWEATVTWLWRIHGIVGQESSAQAPFLNLFDHLQKSVEKFLNNDMHELSTSDPEARSVARLFVIACDAHLKFSKNLTSKQTVQEAFQQIVQVVQHASSHVYASDSRTVRAAMILSSILHHLNSTTANHRTTEKPHDFDVAEQKVDHSLEVVEELLRASGPDILELLLRKLTTAPLNFSHADSSFAFLDLASELYTFITASVSSGVQGLQVYYHFIESLIQRSREIVLSKQSDRYQLTLSDWRLFVLSMQCLALCCTALRKEPRPHSTLLVHTLSQAIAELDLSSEFPKPKFLYPGEVRDETSAETSPFVRKGWGRLVSDFLDAQWLCIEFLLQESQRCKELEHKLEPFLADLPEAALEALSLGSGLAVLPVIRCVHLLTPRMLLKDDSLCSQALESIWWTFQDRQKGDHIGFWGTLREITRVIFNPCLLTLPEDHPVSPTVRKYWGELLVLGEDRAGIVNHVIEPCCKFWTSSPSDQNQTSPTPQISEEDRKRSLGVHLDFITEACVFGPREKKTSRVTNYVLEYVRRLGEQCEICPINVDELRDDTRVRVNAVNLLMMLHPENARDMKLLKRVVQALIARNSELMEEKPRSSINSYSHRRKHRVWQAILVALSRLLEADAGESFARDVLEGIFRAILGDNQVSVRNFLQWGVVLILGRFPSLKPLLWEQLKYDQGRRAGSVFSFLVITALVGEFSFSDSRSQAAYFRKAFPAVLPWVLASHVKVCTYAQVALQKMWLTCQRRNLRDVISDHSLIKPCVDFLETNNEGLRLKTRLLADFFFLDLHPYRDFSVQTLFETLPRLSEVTDEEWISPNVFTQGSLGVRVWKSSGKGCCGLPLMNPDGTRLAHISNAPYFNYEENIGEQITRRLAGGAVDRQGALQTSDAGNGGICGPQSGDVQKKITPWKVIPPDEEMMSEIQQQRMANLQKSSAGNLIVVASLIDKAPNLGGLCRTCEIFGVQTLVLGNTHVTEDVQFKSLSVSAAKWMDIQEARMSELKSYLASMRHEGYTLVGVEQTANSITLTRYQFSHKTLLLLGNEKEGIPVELIQMLDVCVEIPQVGVIRSLNVHVSGALLVWEYTRQRILGEAT